MTALPAGECHAVLMLVSAYLDGDLDRASCESIEVHCRACPACADVVAGLREAVGLCRRAGSVPVPEDVLERARARVRRLMESSAGNEGTRPADRSSDSD